MWKNPRNRFLCQEVAEVPAAAGAPAAAAAAVIPPAAGAVVPPAAPSNGPPAGGAETPPAAAAPAAAATAEPSFLQQVKAGLKDKGTLMQERDAANTRAQTAETALATANAELTTLRAENATLKAERAEIQAALTGEQGKTRSVEQAAATVVAQTMGVDPAALPAQAKDGSGLEALYAKLEAATDPMEISRINSRINKLEAEQRESN
jgi:hypothetical protein